MKAMNKLYTVGIVLAAILITLAAFTRQTEPWTPSQLLDPADLAARINHPSGVPPLVIGVGPSGLIKGSIETGPARDQHNLDKLKALLDKEDRNKEVIIYCGCCPFQHCPNIRPAFTLLNDMHFIHTRLLNLSHNIKVDWIDHGYPVTASK
ncbi:rhodanese-like domain-containing protein [Puia dinghuensis]|nr:rhodanese-like domain-containing protein [Puia dinghuensis]